MPDAILVRDERRIPRHAIVYADDWNTPRFRMLSAAARLVYVTLAMHAGFDHSRKSWPKVATISEITGYAESTVRNALTELRRLGYVEIGKKRLGLRRINVYTLKSPPEYPPPPPVS